MTEKRFTIKPQDDYFGITDNNTADKVNVINGIRTEIEAEWLCDLMNELAEENENITLLVQHNYEESKRIINRYVDKIKDLERENKELKEENEQLKQDIENLKITIEARETLIDVCEKKFKELGYIITVDDDGYVIE